VGDFTYHSVYGLRLQSNVPVPGLPILDKSNNEINSRVWLKEKSHPVPAFSESFKLFHQSPNSDDHGNPNVRVCELDKDHLIFFYPDNLRFALARDGNEVVADWPDDYSLEDAATYLLGPVMGFVLRLRGILPLHASCVAVDDRAIALLGVPGAGKSTTAAAFARMGYPILSEDVATLDEHGNSFWVQPGYPRINLWPPSVEAMFGDENALPVVTPAWGKRFLSLGQSGLRFQSDPLPLSAIYFLAARNSESRLPIIEPLDGTAALMTLVANTYVNYALDSAMRSHEFDVLSRLISNVSVMSVRASDDSADLAGLCNGIAEDARKRRTAQMSEQLR
jgi:hypothetical protein